MADIARFVQKLRLAGIRLSLDGDEIRLRGTQAMDDATRLKLKARRDEVLAYLRQSAGPRPRSEAHRTEAPLSFAQRRLWFLERWHGPGALYNEAALLRLDGPLDDQALSRAIEHIIARHEILRTTYHDRSGLPFQRIHPPEAFRIDRIDLTGQSIQVDVRLQAEVRAQIARPFDLALGPMVRGVLYRTGADSHHLCLVMHHIACDGWSSGVLVSELSDLYAAFSAGHPDPLPPLAIQYADYAIWQTASERRQDETADLAYWHDHLAGAPERIGLPTDLPRIGEDTAGGSVDFALPPDLVARVAELARHHHATPYMVLLTAFYALLGRLGGDEDIVIGGAIANRDRPEIEPLVGFFVNTLALRVDLSGMPSFTEALRRVVDIAHGAFAHQALPFDQLITQMMPERAKAHAPLFQVMFSLQNAPGAAVDLAGLRVTRVPLPCFTSKFDLTLFLRPGKDGYTGTFEYRTALFHSKTVTRLGRLYVRLLQAALASPDIPVAHLSLLEPGEEARLLEAGIGPATPFPRDLGIPEQVAQIAARMPSAVAVCDGTTELDYQTLMTQARSIASALRNEGIAPGDRVALGLDRSIPMVVASLGVLMAGAIYVPLDPDHPPERTAALLKQSGTRLVIGRLAASALAIMDFTQMLAVRPLDDLPTIDPMQPAYMMYTSGSTGLPKGVVVPHRAILRLVLGQDFAAFGPGRRFAGVSNPAFDAATFEIWGALLTGGRLDLIDRETLLSPAAFAQTLRHRRIDNLFLTAALFNRIAEDCPTAFGGLHSLLVGGEAPSARHVSRVLQSDSPPANLRNSYGPTECTTFAVVSQIDLPDAPNQRVPLGGPIANTTLWILDGQLRPCPPGVPGEIYIGGDALALGYHDDPAQTANRFIVNPFGPGRLYRTGDLARLRDEWRIDLLGRTDDLVKLRGFRIEPEEVAQALKSHPRVSDALVIPRRDGETLRLTAYVVPHLVDSGEDETLTSWTELFDTTYAATKDSSPIRAEHFDGWVSSATDAPIPLPEMREWLASTLAELKGAKGRHILEIGAGTGLLLAALAPDAASYVATDISRTALDRLALRRASQPDLAHVRLLHQPAHVVAGLDQGQGYDLIILNSVVQYFPGTGYLLQVLGALRPLLRAGGRIYLGDLRNLDLLTEFHTWIARERLGPNADPHAVQDLVSVSVADESELVLSPDLFRRIESLVPGLVCHRVALKRGRGRNEMAVFRYSVDLTATAQATLPHHWQDWQDSRAELSGIEALLQQAGAELALSSIPNARVHDAIGASGAAIDPEDLHALAERAGCTLHLTFARNARWMDALFTRSATALATGRFGPAPAAPASLGNTPALARIARSLRTDLRRHARHLLPEHMVPAAIVLLAQFPLTSNGKIARALLPSPNSVDLHLADKSGHSAPQTEAEQIIHAIWAEVLGTSSFGIHDRFFDIGGHSLLATQVVSRLKDRFGQAPTLRAFFEAPTISALATGYSEPAADQEIVLI